MLPVIARKDAWSSPDHAESSKNTPRTANVNNGGPSTAKTRTTTTSFGQRRDCRGDSVRGWTGSISSIRNCTNQGKGPWGLGKVAFLRHSLGMPSNRTGRWDSWPPVPCGCARMSFRIQLVPRRGSPAMISGDTATASGSSGSVGIAPSILGAWTIT